jgi:cell division protease FtsH
MAASPTPPDSPKSDGHDTRGHWLRVGVGGFVAGALAAGLVYVGLHPLPLANSQEMPYSEFKIRLVAGDISEVTLGARIDGTLKTLAASTSAKGFYTYLPGAGDPDLLKELGTAHVLYRAAPPTPFTDVLFQWIIPLAFLAVLWSIVSRGLGTRMGGVLGGCIPKGVLLIGPPGTGKTLIAKATAGEAGVRFFETGGSEFVEMFVGVGAARVRDLFEQFLAEIDGFKADASNPVILMAATNRPKILDPALLRKGRFDRQVMLGNPDLAALLSARHQGTAITFADFEAAIERVVGGLEQRTRVMNAPERKTVAYHESGHALIASLVPNGDPVSKISIIPRSRGSLGYTMQMPKEDRYLLTVQELEDQPAVMMGGRAAEHLALGTISTGAVDDIERATQLARRMVTEFGMSDRLGSIRYAGEHLHWLQTTPDTDGDIGAETREAIDAEIRRLIGEQYARAEALLSSHRHALAQLAARLLDVESLDGSAVARVLAEAQPLPAAV